MSTILTFCIFLIVIETAFIQIQNPSFSSNYYEQLYRNYVIETNRQKILSANQQLLSFKLEANKFLQYTQREFQNLFLTTQVSNYTQVVSPFKVETSNSVNVFIDSNYSPNLFGSINLLSNIDLDINWTRSGAVTSVKNQGGCGSCWAFAAISDLQSSYLINGYQGNIDLSQQQLVDCASGFYNFGCAGGWMTNAFAYIYKNPVTTQSVYPYIGTSGICKNATGTFTLKNIRSYWENKNCQLLVDILQIRPFSVAVAADPFYWGFYKSGVLNQCSGRINHGVVVTGVKKNQTDNYWIVKNSWGLDWGENGYIRLDRSLNDGNLCDICSYPQYSII